MNATREKSHLLISCPLELRENFKSWCQSQGVSMNKAFSILMRQMTNGKNYQLKEAFLRRKANS